MANDRVNDNRRETYVPPRTKAETNRVTRNDRPYRTAETKKSSFEKLLDETSQSYDSNLPADAQGSRTETRDAVRSATSEQGHSSASQEQQSDFLKKLKEKEKESEPRDSHGDDSKSVKKENSHRISGHGSSHRDGGGGGGQQGQQGSSSGNQQGHSKGGSGQGQKQDKEGKSMTAMPGAKKMGPDEVGPEASIKKTFSEMLVMSSPSTGAPLPGSSTTSSLSAKSTLPTELPKPLLDQMVRYCRLMTKGNGDKEMEFQLKEDMFRGMRIKVALSNGKISATFLSAHEDIKSYFQSHKNELMMALAEKGVEVKSVSVMIDTR